MFEKLTKTNLARLEVKLSRGAYSYARTHSYADRPIGHNWHDETSQEIWRELEDLRAEAFRDWRKKGQ